MCRRGPRSFTTRLRRRLSSFGQATGITGRVTALMVITGSTAAAVIGAVVITGGNRQTYASNIVSASVNSDGENEDQTLGTPRFLAAVSRWR